MTKNIPGSRRILIKRAIDSSTIEEKEMIVRTTLTNWVNTKETVIIPLSIYSIIHDESTGYFKIGALINFIKSKAKGKIIILICEGAHLNVISLKRYNNMHHTLQTCRVDAEKLFQ